MNAQPRIGRTLAVVHIFYPEIWPELRACLRVVRPDDVIVTYVDEEAVTAVRRDLPDARFVLCENRGFDVWPFLRVLQETDLSAYGLVVKLHTKRDVDFGFDFRIRGCAMSGSAWRERLVAFCRTERNWRRTREAFGDPSVGMVAERHLVVRREDVPYGHAERAFDAAVRELDPPGGSTAGLRYVAGTMFAARPEVLAFLLRRPFTPGMFDPSAHVAVTDCRYAHVVERLIGFAVTACGRRIAAFNPSVAERLAAALPFRIWR